MVPQCGNEQVPSVESARRNYSHGLMPTRRKRSRRKIFLKLRAALLLTISLAESPAMSDGAKKMQTPNPNSRR